MTELSFLIELLLNHKLPRTTQLAIKERIKDIETRAPAPQPQRPVHPMAQAPSMQAKIEAMEQDLQANPPQVALPPPVTNAAAQALQLRQQIIQNAMAENGGHFEPGRKSARKF